MFSQSIYQVITIKIKNKILRIVILKSPIFGGGGGIRTLDTPGMSRML